MDILSEEEVSYYKKSLISQEGSIKKGAPGDAPVVAKSALWGVITLAFYTADKGGTGRCRSQAFSFIKQF